MSELLSPEEKERIRKEQMRRIAELEKRRREAGAAAASPADGVSAADAERRRRQAVEEYKARVLAEEMERRGFVRDGDEWVSREEFAERRAREEEERARLAGKMERAKERKVERDEEAYNQAKAARLPLIGMFARVFWAGAAASAAGSLLLFVYGVRMVGPGAFLNVVGGGACLVALYVLFETERDLMRKQRVLHEGEMYDFEYQTVKDPLRRAVRWLARVYDPVVRAKFEE